MAYVVSLTQFARTVRRMGPELEAAIIRGLRSSAYRLEGYIVQEIDDAGAVATSELRSSVDTEPTPRGAVTGTDAPHSPFVEYGTRPHMPPTGPLEDWIRIKGLATDDDEVEELAQSIAWTIARYGTEPRFYLKKAVQRLKRDRVVDEEIRSELAAIGRRL